MRTFLLFYLIATLYHCLVRYWYSLLGFVTFKKLSNLCGYPDNFSYIVRNVEQFKRCKTRKF